MPSATYSGQQEVEQGIQPGVELGEPAAAADVLDDPLVAAGQRPELGLVVGVGEEADIEQEVGVAGGPVLEAEAREVDGELRRSPGARGRRRRSSGGASPR